MVSFSGYIVCINTSVIHNYNCTGDIQMLIPSFLESTVPEEESLFTYVTQEQLYRRTVKNLLYCGHGPPIRYMEDLISQLNITIITVHACMVSGGSRILKRGVPVSPAAGA